MSKEKNVILIVDDMEINRVVLAETFKDNYEIIEAENGEEALKVINSNDRIAAVLLDLLMPVMGGIDVLREMNKSGKINNVPVFIVTGANDDPMLMDAYNLGATDIISKPIMADFIKCRINNVLELYRHRYDLETLLEEKIDKLNLINQSMIEALANIIEFRDGESGEHVKRISSLSKKYFLSLTKNTPSTISPVRRLTRYPMLQFFTMLARSLYPTVF